MKLYESKEFLRKRLLVDRMSLAEVAKQCGVDERTIRRWAKEHGIIK